MAAVLPAPPVHASYGRVVATGPAGTCGGGGGGGGGGAAGVRGQLVSIGHPGGGCNSVVVMVDSRSLQPKSCPHDSVGMDASF